MSTNSIRKSLTDIVEKLEGQQITGKNLDIRQALTRIADAIEGGGYGGGDFIVTFTYDQEAYTFVCDKTMEEIADAVTAGKHVRGVASVGDEERIFFELVQANMVEGGEKFYFQNISEITSHELEVTHDGEGGVSVSYFEREFQEV